MSTKGVEGPFHRGSKSTAATFLCGLAVGLVLGYIFWGGRPQWPPTPAAEAPAPSAPVPEGAEWAEEPGPLSEEDLAARPPSPVSGPMDHLVEEIDPWPARLVFVSVPGPSLDVTTRTFLKSLKPGGVLLGEDNVKNAAQTAELVKQIKQAVGLGSDLADLPLIGLSLEDECLKRIMSTPVPSPKELGDSGNVDAARRAGRECSTACKEAGIAVVLGPSFDTYEPGISDAWADRFFSSDHLLVASLGLAFAQGLMEGGVIPVAKHFPGRGAVREDPLETLPVLAKDRAGVAQVLFPFMQAANWGVPGILTGHIASQALDKDAPRRPASLSPVMVTEYLRDRWAYDGVIMTDDLAMKAITNSRPPERAAVEALAAGNDALLYTDRDPVRIRTLCKALEQAVEDGRLPRDTLVNSVRRLDHWQAWLRSPTGLKQPVPLVPGTTSPDAAQLAEAEMPPEEIIEGTSEAIHVVSPGENLSRIAAKYGVTLNEILDWNKLKDTKLLIGQKLKIRRAVPPVSPPDAGSTVAAAGEETPSPSTSSPAESGEAPPASSEEEATQPASASGSEDVSMPGAPPPEDTAQPVAEDIVETVAQPPSESEVAEETAEGEPEKPEAAPAEPKIREEPEVPAELEESTKPEEPAAPEVQTETGPADGPAPRVEYQTYLVQPGDTIYALARRFRVSQDDLLKANNMTISDKLLYGRKLRIPKPVQGPGPSEEPVPPSL